MNNSSNNFFKSDSSSWNNIEISNEGANIVSNGDETSPGDFIVEVNSIKNDNFNKSSSSNAINTNISNRFIPKLHNFHKKHQSMFVLSDNVHEEVYLKFKPAQH